MFSVMTLSGGVAASAVGIASALLLHRLLPQLDARAVVVRIIVFAAVVLDVLWLWVGRPRPLAVHRQVPQGWGHRNGPFLAALRYGPRLGVGPATILTSWLWWAAFAVGCVGGWRVAATAALTFAAARTLTMWAVTIGVAEGRAMAGRVAALRARETVGQWLSLLVAVGCAVGTTGWLR